jgi:hypothetical protein
MLPFGSQGVNAHLTTAVNVCEDDEPDGVDAVKVKL